MNKATLHVDNYIEMITIIHIYIFIFLTIVQGSHETQS